MDKKTIVRVQLFVLAALALLLVGRVFQGLPMLDGEVTISDVARTNLYHKAFQVLEAGNISISAFGSVEAAQSERSADAVMAAYPWIVRRDDRSLVWRMDPVHSKVEDGTLLKAEETIELDAGIYDLYYASFGSDRRSSRERRFLGVRLGSHWTADRNRWQVALKAATGQIKELDDKISDVGPHGLDNVIWTSGAMKDDRDTDQILVVDSPVDVFVYSIGEICDEPRCGDYGAIENLATHKEVWRLTKENSRPAGGSASNFVFDGQVALDRGLYRVYFKTDGGHAYGRWFGNPPYDPTSWGVTVYAMGDGSTSNIRPFDVWKERSPIVKLAPAGSSVQFEQTFDVSAPVDVLLYSMGEVHGDSRYDYGFLEDADSGDIVWKMGENGVRHAGGSRDNSIAEGIVELKPGKYVLRYKSDDSHAYGDWYRDKPDHEERWGVTMFAVESGPASAISLTATTSSLPRGEQHEVNGSVVFSLLAAGNDQSVTNSIELNDDSRVHIRAIGEVSEFGEYDYGWIQSDSSKEIVWKMTRTNTSRAGGDERFRLFDDYVSLPAGEYTIHFETDESHAYGDFGDTSPDFAEDYGMKVVLVSE